VRCPTTAVDRPMRVDLFTRARQKRARVAWASGWGRHCLRVVHLECDLVKLRDGVSTDLPPAPSAHVRATVHGFVYLAQGTVGIVGIASRLAAGTAKSDGAVIDLPDDEHRADDTGRQALQHDRLIVVDGYRRAIVRVGYGIRRGRREVGLGRRWRRVLGARLLLDVDDIEHESIYIASAANLREKTVGTPHAVVFATKDGVAARV
jgi:hypothetical protein